MMTPDEILSERGMPASIDAERSLLGAIMLENAAFDEADITRDDFSLDSHRRIYSAMVRLRGDNRVVDIITLSEELRNAHEIEAIGGVAYLTSLTEGLPRRPSCDEYVRIVKDKAQLRCIINACVMTVTAAADQGTEADELIADHDTRMLEITSGNGDTEMSLGELCIRQYPRLLEEREGRAPDKCVATGLDILDDALGGGWQKGELAVIAGRPGDGKSSLLLQTLIECGRNGIPALCFQLEMDEAQILRRMLSAMTGIPFAKFRYAQALTPVDMTRIAEAQEALRRFPVRIEVARSLTAAQLVSRARIAKRRYGVQFIGLDYLQKLKFTSSKPEMRYIAVGDAAQQLANLAKDEGIVVVALSSLTEKTGRAHDAKPSMADIRQSGDVQYEAATVILLHRDKDAEKPKDAVFTGPMIVGKQRQGETGDFAVKYLHCLKFERLHSKPNQQQQDFRYANA